MYGVSYNSNRVKQQSIWTKKMNTQKHFFGIGQNRIGSSNTNRKYSNITPKIVSETLLRGKSIEELTYSEFLNRLKELRQKTSFAQIVGNYGIYKYRDKKQTYYHAADLRTNLDVLTGRKTIKKIISDIQKGDIEYLKRQNPNMFDPRYMYQLFKRSHIESEKYSERVKRFALKQGQKVLDLAAGDYPDLRATHAIDLKKPSKSFKGLNYKYGYNFNKETIKLPYSNNYFDIVVSIGGLGRNFESQKKYIMKYIEF